MTVLALESTAETTAASAYAVSSTAAPVGVSVIGSPMRKSLFDLTVITPAFAKSVAKRQAFVPLGT